MKKPKKPVPFFARFLTPMALRHVNGSSEVTTLALGEETPTSIVADTISLPYDEVTTMALSEETFDDLI